MTTTPSSSSTTVETTTTLLPEETTIAPETTVAPATTAAPETTAAPQTTAAPATTDAPETTAAPAGPGDNRHAPGSDHHHRAPTTTCAAHRATTTIPEIVPQPGDTLWDIIEREPAFDGWQDLVERADLVSLFDGTDDRREQYAVFAGTNEAVAAFNATTGGVDQSVLQSVVNSAVHFGAIVELDDLVTMDEIERHRGQPTTGRRERNSADSRRRGDSPAGAGSRQRRAVPRRSGAAARPRLTGARPCDRTDPVGSPAVERPIGMFDSGFGGLTVARALIDLMPAEDLVYIGDTGRYPYGSKPLDEVRGYAGELAWSLVKEYNVKAVVVACNTATAAGLDDLRVGVAGAGARRRRAGRASARADHPDRAAWV